MALLRLVTAEELLGMGGQDIGYELVRGRPVPVSPAGGQHGVLTTFLARELDAVARPGNFGRVYTETGFVLARNPDTVRGPDVSFAARDRPAGRRPPRGFVEGPPTLAVEIRSPDNTLSELTDKAGEYIAAGAALVWVVDPPSRRVFVRRPGQPVETLGVGNVLDGAEVLPGLAIEVRRLFAELEE